MATYIGNTYQQIQQAVADYYGSGSDAWAKIYAGAGGYYSPEAAQIIQQVPGVTVTRSNSGKILSYSYANTFESSGNPASIIDSNVQTGTYGNGSFSSSIPSTVIENEQGNLVVQSGSRLSSSGATVATVIDRLSLAAVGVGLGCKLGKAIDSAIYSTNPQWWDEHYPTINPETWDNMATTEGGKQFIQALFGLESDTTTMYIDERLLAQTYMMFEKEGVNGSGYSIASVPEDSTWLNGFPNSLICGTYLVGGMLNGYFNPPRAVTYEIEVSEGIGVLVSNNKRVIGYAYSTLGQPVGKYNDNRGYLQPFYNFTSGKTLVSKTTYYQGSGMGANPSKPIANSQYGQVNIVPSENYDIIATILIDGTIVKYTAVNGIDDDNHAEIHIDPNLITGTNIEDVLEQLKENYPELFEGSIYQDTPQDDGTVNRITYIPVPIPNGITSTMPVTGETSQSDPSVNPNKNSDSLIDEVVQIIGHPETYPQNDISQLTPTNPPNTGDGNTPIVVPITGSASTLWKIYNPSQTEIDAFGGWLWSSNFIDQIKKLFSDPMQAIIGIHKVFCTPSIGGVTTIKCGYLDSEISCNWVSEQYTHIDCGTINLPEYFGNVFDYNPYTRVSLFLPCVGIVPLDVSEIMRSSINVKLHCDVLTGALLAEISVIRDQTGGVLYTYSGSCIVTYPVSSGSYIGAISNIVSLAAGIIGTVASGGELAPALAGTAISQLSHTRANVQHSGSFSGAVGVMGGKIPYLIISRPQTRMAEQYQQYDGVPANFTTRLSDCSGYIKVKEVHLKVPNAYETEIAEIEQLLHEGILI